MQFSGQVNIDECYAVVYFSSNYQIILNIMDKPRLYIKPISPEIEKEMKEFQELLNKPISAEMQDKMNEIWNSGFEIISEQLQKYHKQREEVFEFSLRNTCKPPIKGEITKGKIKWRGIVHYTQYNNNFISTEWLSQRGIQISPKLSLDCTPDCMSIFP